MADDVGTTNNLYRKNKVRSLFKKKIPSIMEGCEHWGIFFNEVYTTITSIIWRCLIFLYFPETASEWAANASKVSPVPVILRALEKELEPKLYNTSATSTTLNHIILKILVEVGTSCLS